MTAQAKLVLCVSLTIPWAVFKILYLYFFKSSETLEEFSYAFSDFAWSLFMVFCVGLVANIVTFSSSEYSFQIRDHKAVDVVTW